MGIRPRKKHMIQAGGVGAASMLIICGISGYMMLSHVKDEAFKDKKEYERTMAEYEKEAHANHLVLSLVSNVKKGQRITENMVKEVYVPKNASGTKNSNLTLANINNSKYFAKTDVPKNSVITSTLMYKEENIANDVREVEYAFVELPNSLAKDEYIDIRIQFPNGDDYVLLGKKKVKNVLGITTWLDIDEGEILTMSSAIVDASQEGARIYAIKYVDEHMQKNSEMTYPVKLNVLQLISEDPNIVNEAKLNLTEQNRARLDAALEDLTQDQKDSISSSNARIKNDAEAANKTAEESIEAVAEDGAQDELINGTREDGE